MDEKRKQPGRDLSDLKARLGLTKNAPTAPTGASGAAAPPPGVAGPSPQPLVPPVTGHHPLVGAPTGQQPAPAPQPEPRRNPFAAMQAAAAAAPVIADAGPPIALPTASKSRLPVVVGVIALLLVGLGIGYMFRGVFHARQVFNRTIEDASRIREEIGKLAKIDEQIGTALVASRGRNQKRIVFDQQLVDELEQIQQASSYATPEAARTVENTIFRTNYARMADLLISQLFSYYNNTLRMLSTVGEFVAHAKANKAAIETYTSESAEVDQRNYGIVLAADKGSYYLGALVEVGRPYCADAKATETGKCLANEVQGFEVRAGSRGRWSQRPGKPSKRVALSDVVVPIIPDKAWQAVATAKPGFNDYRLYGARYAGMMRIQALLDKTRKELLESLGKQAGRAKLAGL